MKVLPMESGRSPLTSLVIELEKNTVGQGNIIHIVKRNNVIKAMLINIAFLDVYDKFSLKGGRMHRLKK